MVRVLFVCSGNTCRSPMAEALFNALARERGLAMEAASAGIGAFDGDPAMSAAIEAVADIEHRLTGHRARRTTAGLLGDYDVVVGMTRAHAQRLVALFPAARERIIAYADLPGGSDIEDPYLGSGATYARTRRAIEAGLAGLVEFVAQKGAVR